MRKLLGALLIASLNAYAIPPISVDGEVTTVGNYVQNVKLPNEQATQLTSRNTRIETGNSNLLKNPSFEHMTADIGWTTTNATKSSESVNVVEGKKSLKMVLTGALNAFQDSTINASQLTGLQGAVSIKIKTSNVDGLKVCARNAAVTSTSLCVNVVADGQWKSVVIPFILSTTSNGIAITSTGTSGTVYIDEAFVGTSAPFQNVVLDNVYSAQVSATGVVSGENIDWINGNCTNANPTVCSFNSGVFSVKPNCTITLQTNGSSVGMVTASSGSSVSVIMYDTVPRGALALSSMVLTCQKSGNDYLASSARVYSQESNGGLIVQAFGAAAATTAGNPIKFPTIGSDTTNGAYSTSTGLFTVTQSGYYDVSAYVDGGQSAANTNLYVSIDGNTTAGYNRPILMQQATTSGTMQGSAVVYATVGQTISIRTSTNQGTCTFASLQIKKSVGLSPIIGSFEKIEKCTGATECVDVFSAQVSSGGVVSNENMDWISGNCTNATSSVCTFNSGIFTVAPICVVSPDQQQRIVASSPASASSVTVIQQLDNGALLASGFSIHCQKSGVDYKPKTAKVASSIGVPTVPGLTTQAVDTFSVSFGTTNATTVCSASPCSYLDQIGTAVSSVTRSALGFFSANTVRTYSKLKWQVIGQQAGGAYHIIRSAGSCSNCNAATFEVANNTATANVDIYGTIIFQGSY